MDSDLISTPKYSILPPDTVGSQIAETLPIGTRLLNYVITEVIGQGGFGITYRAREDVSNRIVVIKENYPTHPKVRIVYRSPEDGKTVVPCDSFKETYATAKKCLVTEAKTLIKLSHNPRIVELLTVFPANNTVYIVMELLKGSNMHERYQPPATMPEHELRPFLNAMLEALAFLHGHGIVHRDIKPQNIIITPDGKPVLIDFGAARPIDPQRPATQIGTKYYAPPEQMSESEYNKYPEANLDIYALGATCYRLITGYEPDYMFTRLAEDPAIKEKYSPELLRSIDKAREQKPCKRWKKAKHWLAALNPTERKRPGLGMVSALLLPTIAIPAAYLYYHQQSEHPLPAAELTEQKSALTTPKVEAQKQPVPNKSIVTDAKKRIENKQYNGLVDMLLPAANQNYAPAQFLLGVCYANEYGVKKNPKQAVYWYRKAAEQNHAEAQCELGFCYENGTGIDKDATQAAHWFQKAAEQNHAWAQYNLGVCYENGTGVDKNPLLAFHWYQKSAQQNNAWAQYNLGNCYMNGTGIDKNSMRAVYWYRRSAEQNFAESQYNLGVCYENGIGVKKDPKQAAYWFRKAADNGFQLAKDALK